MTRKAAFYYRGLLLEDESMLGCPECGAVIDHIPADWLDRHVGEHVPCPRCHLDSRIPSRDEGMWPLRKDAFDSQRGVEVPERERARF